MVRGGNVQYADSCYYAICLGGAGHHTFVQVFGKVRQVLREPKTSRKKWWHTRFCPVPEWQGGE